MEFIIMLGALGLLLSGLVRVTIWWIDRSVARLLNEVFDANANLTVLTERRRQRITRQLKGYRYDVSRGAQPAIETALRTLDDMVIRTTPFNIAPEGA